MPASEQRTVLVTDAARGSALAAIRSLGRAGFRVVAADSDPRAPGLRSRHAAAARTYPRPEVSTAALRDALFEIVCREHVDLVLPVTDLVLQPLAADRARFEAVTRLALPADAALATACDKQATFELARRLGVPVPETHTVRTVSEAREAAGDLGWPVVLKPRASKRIGGRVEAFAVTYAASESELELRMRPFEGRTPVLLQRWVPGEGHGIEMLLQSGRPIAAFQHRRLREVPVTGGASADRVSVPLDPELFAYSSRLLEAMRWTGLAMVEFRVGPSGTHLMEINGRVWGSLPLAVAAGVDFPRLLVQLLLDGERNVAAPPIGSYRIGVRRRDLQRDLVWIANVLWARKVHTTLPFPPRRAGLAALASGFDPRHGLDSWAWDDPWPGILELPHVLHRIWRKRSAHPSDAPLRPVSARTP